MIKQGVKNFFCSLKYFFTPLGTMFLGMMIGFSVLFPGIFGAIAALVEGIKELAANVNLNFEVLGGDIWSSVMALDWHDPLNAAKTLLSAEWLHDTLTEVLQSILGTDFETFKESIAELVASFSNTIVFDLAVFFTFWVLGFIAGFFIVKFQIRKDIAKRSLWKLLLATALNSLLTSLYIAVMLVLSALWRWAAIIAVVLLILLLNGIALLEAWLIHGRGKVKIKDVVNFKSAGAYALANLIILLISIVITVLACAINMLMGLFVGLTILEIAIIVADLNAESYVKSLAE